MDCDRLVQEIREAFQSVPPVEEVPNDVAAWSGFNAVEFRAHLPAAMLQALRTGGGRGLCWWLTLPLSGDEQLYFQRWSLLDAPQRDCVRRFLLAMIEREAQNENSEPWEEAYESYWADLGPAP